MFSEIRQNRWKLLGDEAGDLLNVATLESNGARNTCKAIRRCIHTLDISIATDVPGYYALRRVESILWCFVLFNFAFIFQAYWT